MRSWLMRLLEWLMRMLPLEQFQLQFWLLLQHLHVARQASQMTRRYWR